MAAFTKGQKGGPGRPPGLQNKINAEVREMVHQALSSAGGVDYLIEQARENPTAFLALVGKLMPTQVNANVSMTLPEILTQLATRKIS